MSAFRSLTAKFTKVGIEPPTPKSEPKKRPAPISIRLNEKELKLLRKATVGRSINGYIRERLFGDAKPLQGRKRDGGVEDYEALARVLGALGQTDIFTSLTALNLAIAQNQLPASRKSEADIQRACAAIDEIRTDLIKALGLRAV